MCVASGMVSGQTQAIDSANIKANATLDSLEVKIPAQTLKEHIREIKHLNDQQDDTPRRKARRDRSNEDQRTIKSSKRQLRDLFTHQQWFKNKVCGPLGSGNPCARYLSNKTHYSPVDPDSRIAVKPGKLRQLYYLSNISVDTAHHVITHIQANYADGKDSLNLIDVIRRTRRRLKRHHLKMDTVLADTGFSNGENYKYLEENKITACIPVHGTIRRYQGSVYVYESVSPET